jgi:hypothetical protein
VSNNLKSSKNLKKVVKKLLNLNKPKPQPTKVCKTLN